MSTNANIFYPTTKPGSIPNFLQDAKKMESKTEPNPKKKEFCDANLVISTYQNDGSHRITFTPCSIRLDDIMYFYQKPYIHIHEQHDGTVTGATKEVSTGIIFKNGEERFIKESYEFLKSQF